MCTIKQLPLILLVLLGISASAMSAECIDTDGDGWGWDGTMSCQTGSVVTPTTCIDTDPQNDGWGWDGVTSCRVNAVEILPEQACRDTPPVGDGWGWDGTTSCRVNPVENVVEQVCQDTPPLGNGWGWNGVESCRVNSNALLPGNIVSSNANFVLFRAEEGDDILLRNLSNDTTQSVSFTRDGQKFEGPVTALAVSADGRKALFGVIDLNVMSSPVNLRGEPVMHIYQRDLTTNSTSLISVNNAGETGNGEFSDTVRMSSDGTLIAFESTSSNLAENDTNNTSDVYVRNTTTMQTTIVSGGYDGSTSSSWSTLRDMSTDGRYILFTSDSNNIVNDGGGSGTFIHDTLNDMTIRVPLNDADSRTIIVPYAISDNGQLVAVDIMRFPDNGPSESDAGVINVSTGVSETASIDVPHPAGSVGVRFAEISPDGRLVAFSSDSILSSADASFVRDLDNGVTQLIPRPDSIPFSNGVARVRFTPDSKHLIVTIYSGRLNRDFSYLYKF